MNRELFIETIEKIEQQHLHDVKCSKLLGQVYKTCRKTQKSLAFGM